MNICPFWSSKKEEVSCFDDCAFASEKEMCPFKLYLHDSEMIARKFAEFDEEAFTDFEDW